MRYLSVFLLSLLSLLQLSAQETQPMSDWMSALPDTTPIRRMSIPGSHDSGAVCGNVFLKVQDASIARQLEMGVRFLDIRLKADVTPGITASTDGADRATVLGVYHSGQYMQQTWEADVLPTLRRFLEEHAREFVTVLLKCEGGDPQAFARLLGRSLAGAGDVAQDFAPELTLGECRGRILFLLRDDVEGSPRATRLKGWDDNATCHVSCHTYGGKCGTLCVEDEYGYESIAAATYKTLATLRNMAAAALDRPAPDGSACWFVSYASCHAVPNNSPEQFADKVNPALMAALPKMEGPFGIVLIDFCERYEPLIRAIAGRN